MIVALAVHLEVDRGRARRLGLARRCSTTDKADPGTVNFVPRPDWYFYFLFYLLRIFKWPRVGDPRHDRHPDDLPDPAARAAVRRPATRAAPAAAARRARRRRRSSSCRWACSRTRARPRRRRSRREVVGPCRAGRRRRASRTTRGRRRARSCSPSPAAELPHLHRHRQLEPRRARPHVDRREAARASSSFAHLTSATRASPATRHAAASAPSARRTAQHSATFLEASKGRGK